MRFYLKHNCVIYIYDIRECNNSQEKIFRKNKLFQRLSAYLNIFPSTLHTFHFLWQSLSLIFFQHFYALKSLYSPLFTFLSHITHYLCICATIFLFFRFYADVVIFSISNFRTASIPFHSIAHILQKQAWKQSKNVEIFFPAISSIGSRIINSLRNLFSYIWIISVLRPPQLMPHEICMRGRL